MTARRPRFYSRAAAGPLSRDRLYEILTQAEPAYRAWLNADTGGTTWVLQEIEGPTENGETLVTWSSPGGTLTLYAIAVTEKLVEVQLYYNDQAGMPEQPRGKRVPVDALGKPGAVLASLLQAYAGKVPWAENPRGLHLPWASSGVRENPRTSYGSPAVAVQRNATSNPLDTSVSSDGWVHWHGDPPDEVGNLGPGDTVKTEDGWWHRQSIGPDAGKLYFQATPGAEYVEPVGLAPELPPPGAAVVENPRRMARLPAMNTLASQYAATGRLSFGKQPDRHGANLQVIGAPPKAVDCP